MLEEILLEGRGQNREVLEIVSEDRDAVGSEGRMGDFPMNFDEVSIAHD